MRYYTYTITDDTGIVKSVEGVPFEDRFKLERRLFDPRPFALDEWTDNAVALYDDEDEDIPPNTDTYTLLLYPVISPRFKALLETTLSPTEVEFLPVHLVGKTTQQPRGTYYLPHCLQAHDCIDHQRLKYSFQVRLFHDRIPPNARLFIAPDPVHNRLVFRDELVNYIRNAGIIGIDFYQLETDAETAEKETVPLGLLFFASPDEQQQWLQQALAEGAYGMLVWQRWHTGGDRIATQIAHLRTPDDTRKVPWELSPADAEATLKLSVYLSRPEWQERFRLVAPEGELSSGGMGEWLELGALDATSQGWYGRLDVGWVSGGVLVRAEWWLPLGWEGVPVSEFGELYGWWEGLGDWVVGRALGDVSVRHRGEEKELDGYVKVLLGAARWYVGGGELRSRWGGGKVRLVGRGLRRLR
jgi:hypothetical protein